MTDPLQGRVEKIKAVYEYLQKNTRYISIQLGIGGWQPFKASDVAEKKYGDCKALSNFTVSLLKEIGIESHYTLIRASNGYKRFWEDFPNLGYFNHAVVCVPNGKDSIWLECTSATNSMGYMGSFTADRKALLITGMGGKVVCTPIYRSSDNRVDRRVKAVISEGGDLEIDASTLYTGIEQESPHELIHYATEEQKQKYLNSYIGLPTYTVLKNNYLEKKGAIPSIEETLKIRSTSFVSTSGKRLFVIPNLLNKWNTRLSLEKERQFDIHYPHAYSNSDSVDIILPEGYQLESVPGDVFIKNDFGSYSILYKVDGNRLLMVRTIERNAGYFSKSMYKSLVSFYEAMYKADRSKVVYVRQ